MIVGLPPIRLKCFNSSGLLSDQSMAAEGEAELA